MFENCEVMFPDTNERAIQKLARRLQKVKIPYTKKFSEFSMKKSNKKNAFEYEDDSNDDNDRYERNYSNSKSRYKSESRAAKLNSKRSDDSSEGEISPRKAKIKIFRKKK